MPKKTTYVKSLKEYEGPFEFDEKAILKAMKKINGGRIATSVALEEETITDLKEVAEKRDVPYQVLMRMLINQGLKRIKENA